MTLKHKVDNNLGAQLLSILRKPTFHAATIFSCIAQTTTLQGVVGNPGLWEMTHGYSKGAAVVGKTKCPTSVILVIKREGLA